MVGQLSLSPDFVRIRKAAGWWVQVYFRMTDINVELADRIHDLDCFPSHHAKHLELIVTPAEFLELTEAARRADREL